MKFNHTFSAAVTVFALGSGLLNIDITAIDAQTNVDTSGQIIDSGNEDTAEEAV
jgi:hypothetical protein